MSKGSKIVPVRLPADLLAEIERQLRSRNESVRAAPWTLSDFIRDCVRERLGKRERRRARAAKAPREE